MLARFATESRRADTVAHAWWMRPGVPRMSTEFSAQLYIPTVVLRCLVRPAALGTALELILEIPGLLLGAPKTVAHLRPDNF